MSTTLTEVCQRAVQEKGTKAVAAELGVNGDVFGNELNPFNDRNKLGADMVYPIVKVTDDDAPIHFLAQRRGGVFIRLPQGNPNSPVDQASLKAVKEFGELMAEFGAALMDGAISRDELRRIHHEGYEAVESIMSLLRQVEVMESER